eukprot:2148033-Amphidinium_carterae.1
MEQQLRCHLGGNMVTQLFNGFAGTTRDNRRGDVESQLETMDVAMAMAGDELEYDEEAEGAGEVEDATGEVGLTASQLKRIIPDEVKTWFLDFRAAKRALHGWSQARSLLEAQIVGFCENTHHV